MSKKTSGFTLVEVMIAVFLLGIAMSGLMSAFIIAAKHSGSSSNKGVATYQATEFMEELKNSVASDPNFLPGGPSGALPPPNYYNPDWHAGCDWPVANCSCDATGNLIPGGCIDDTACYALQSAAAPGVKHYIKPTSLPSDFKTTYGGCVSYYVTDVTSGSQTFKQVQSNVDWNESNL